MIRFTSGVTGSVSPAGPPARALLLYRFTGENEVDLMSTFVPEAFRGQGVAALLSQVTRTRTRTSQTLCWKMTEMCVSRLPSTSCWKRSSELTFPVGT